MPSLLARLTKVYIGYKFSASRNATPEASLENMFSSYAEHDIVDAPPADIAGHKQFTFAEERNKLPGGQEWVVHHLGMSGAGEAAGSSSKKDQVVVYWHGGAFIRKATTHHWQFIRTILLETGLPVVVPHYTKAPLATSSHAILGGIALLISISQDSRYKDKDIVLMGDSAGGWFVLRLILAMTELALGEFTGAGAEAFDREACKEVRRKMKKGVAISGVFELDLARSTHKEDELLQPNDPWLSQVALRPIMPFWTHGHHALTPDQAARLPPDCPALTHPELSTAVPITDPVFTPTNGVDILRRYAEQERPAKPLRLILSIGSADILYNQNVRMHEALKNVGQEVVQSTLIEEAGLYHVYPLVQSLPESKKAIKQFAELLKKQ